MDAFKLVKVATRMLFDVINVLEKKETDFQVGCKCKDETIAKALQSMLALTLQDVDVDVLIKEEKVVVITPSSLTGELQPSSPSPPPTPLQGETPSTL